MTNYLRILVESSKGTVDYMIKRGLDKVCKKNMTSQATRVLPSEVPASVLESLFKETNTAEVARKSIKVSDEEFAMLLNNAPRISAKQIMKDIINEGITKKINSNKCLIRLRYFKNLITGKIKTPQTGEKETLSIN